MHHKICFECRRIWMRQSMHWGLPKKPWSRKTRSSWYIYSTRNISILMSFMHPEVSKYCQMRHNSLDTTREACCTTLTCCMGILLCQFHNRCCKHPLRPWEERPGKAMKVMRIYQKGFLWEVLKLLRRVKNQRFLARLVRKYSGSHVKALCIKDRWSECGSDWI